ncbi:MAG: M16 family metallopeptidase [Candidatus Acidiferrales bacterium]
MRGASVAERRAGLSAAALVVLASLLASAAPARAQTHYKKLHFPALRDLHLPNVERIELPNGLVLYLVEDHTLPKVEGTVLVRTGARFEPADKVGLASILGQAMRTGGTTTRPGEDIDRLLANVGGSVETSVGTTSATASFFALKADLSLVLDILADLLRNPALPDDKIELAKVQEQTAIARRNDDVGEIADREFGKLLYGPSSPYARHTEYATIASITRSDLVSLHGASFHPNTTLLGLWGDFDAAEAKALVERYFGSWERGEVAALAPPGVASEWQGSVNFIQKDDINQTNWRLGHLGSRFDDPDYYALAVMAEVLGGGLSSRLFRHVRSDLGLAYAVFATWSAEYDYPGTFYLRCDTKSESTVRAAQEVIKEIRGITAAPVTADELRVAKEGILNSFVFNFDTTAKIVRRLMNYEYYGYPRDFLDKFKANIEKVTADDVLRAAQKHLQPDRLVLLAVGRQQDFDQPLSALGSVNTLDITIPEPKPAAAVLPEATAETSARGQEILATATKAIGGLEALGGLRDQSVLMRIRQVTPQGELPITAKVFVVWPNKIRQDVALPFGVFSIVYDGQRGWQKTPAGTQDMPAAEVENLRQSRARAVEPLLLEASEGKRKVQFLEATRVEDRPVNVIAVTDEKGDTVKLYIEEGSGRIVKKVNQAVSPFEGAVEEETLYSDFRPVGALTVPFKAVTYQNGKLTRESTIQNYEINVGVDPALFLPEKPAEEKKPPPSQ